MMLLGFNWSHLSGVRIVTWSKADASPAKQNLGWVDPCVLSITAWFSPVGGDIANKTEAKAGDDDSTQLRHAGMPLLKGIANESLKIRNKSLQKRTLWHFVKLGIIAYFKNKK